MKHILILIIILVTSFGSYSQTGPVLKIGLVADPQYTNRPNRKRRHYRKSLIKLKEAIRVFNSTDIDFVQNLGDIIDIDWNSYDSIIPIYGSLNTDIENYHLLGNHDFSIDSLHKENLLSVLSMPDYYYSYVVKGWRFIVLDATDYSHYSNSLHRHDIDSVNSYYEYTKAKSNHYRWNGAIGANQQNWLKHELKTAELQKQKVIIFSHMPIRPLGTDENLWNDYEIIDIVENSSCVVAYINGHKHSGGYVFKNGIHYITIAGMIQTRKNSYGILELSDDSMLIRGYGNQKSFHLKY